MGQIGGLDTISPRILNPYYSIGGLNAFSYFFQKIVISFRTHPLLQGLKISDLEPLLNYPFNS